MSEILRSKWIMDGATTLEEAAAQLEESAKQLRRMHAKGYKLQGPIQDDYGFIVKPRKKRS